MKTRNLRADPRAARLVHTDIYDEFVVAEGAVALSPPSHRPGDATGLALIEHYRALAGEHPDWDDYLVAMVRDRRLLARLHVQRTYRGGAR